MRGASYWPAAGHPVSQVGSGGLGRSWQVEGVAGHEARRARCQASSCSRRRAGGGPGAPRSPAAADANLCPRPSRQPGAGGARRRAGGGGVGTAGPRRLTWHCRFRCCVRTRDCGHRLCRDRLSWHVGTLPRDVTTTALLSSSRSSSFRCPQTPISPNKHACTTPGSAHHPQRQVTPSPLAHFSHHRLFIAPQCPSPTQFAHCSKYLHPPDLQFPPQIHLPAFHPTRDQLSLYHPHLRHLPTPPQHPLSPQHPISLPSIPWGYPICYCRVSHVWEEPGGAGAHSRHSWRRRRQSWALSGAQVCRAPSGGHRRWYGAQAWLRARLRWGSSGSAWASSRAWQLGGIAGGTAGTARTAGLWASQCPPRAPLPRPPQSLLWDGWEGSVIGCGVSMFW